MKVEGLPPARMRAAWMRWSLALAMSLGALLSIESTARATMIGAVALEDLTATADRVFRGRCLAAEVGTAEVAGGRIEVTTYSFSVGEYLKGSGPEAVTFRQAGTPAGGPGDLGSVVGLPTYSPGSEYVLFLLPTGRAGLTSPAGAGDGAFAVVGTQVRSMRGVVVPQARTPAARSLRPGAAGEVAMLSYEELRRIVTEQVRQRSPATP